MKKRIVYADRCGTLLLGRQGENDVTEIVFSVPSDLADCEWLLNHQRATDSESYPIPLDERDGTLVWTVTSGDTDIAGRGCAELTCYGSNGEVLKSQLYATTVIKALSSGGEVPDPVQPWYESLLKRIDSIDGVSPEEIAAAVESYIEENPIESGATAEQVQQIEENTEAIEQLKKDVPTDYVKTVNGVEPDENGNVEIDIPDSSENAYELPVATSEELGGVMPVSATSEMTQEVGVDAEGKLFTKPGSDGEDGGYYTPAVSQVDENTMKVSFTASKEGMVAVADRNITLPAGKDGADGSPGADGQPGSDGEDGKDGVSVTHSWNGTVLTVTSASGTSSADLKGEKGDTGAVGVQGPKGDTGETGATGAAGYTPVRGTDYWTASDIAEIKSYVDEAILGGAW